MTQANPIIGADKSGIEYRLEDNDGKKALLNHHKGSSPPSYAEAGALWLDDAATPWLLKLHDGADWITVAAVHAGDDTVAAFHGQSMLRLLNHAADTGAVNAYAVAPSPPIAAYEAGQIVTLCPANASTGDCTLNVNSLGAKAVKLADGTHPPAGTLLAGGMYQLVYDGTDFILLGGPPTTITIKDAGFTLQDDGDATKQVKFQASGVSSGTTRTLSVPNASGTIALTSDIPSSASQAQMEAASATTVFVTPQGVKWAPGVPKFWIKAAGDGSSIAASYNVTSITDVGTGEITVTIGTDFSSAHWCCGVQVERASNTLTHPNQRFGLVKSGAQSAGAVTCLCVTDESSVSQADPASWHIFGLGDQ